MVKKFYATTKFQSYAAFSQSLAKQDELNFSVFIDEENEKSEVTYLTKVLPQARELEFRPNF